MQSLKNIAIVKTACAICFYPELKREILCARKSEFDVTKSRHQYCRKEQWNAIIEKKAREILRRQRLINVLEDEVLKLMPAIGLKMLIWAEYHEGTLGFTREYSVYFLRYSHMSREGVVDNVKAAKDLMEYGYLSVMQKYKLACLYCFEDNIGPLYKLFVKYHGKDAVTRNSNIRWFQKPDIVQFWTSQKTGKMEKNPNVSPDVLRMRHAVRSGSKAAVIYSWNVINSGFQGDVLLDAVTEILRAKISKDADWKIFNNWKSGDHAGNDDWVPTDYSEDIARFIFLKVFELQQQCVLQIPNYFDPRRIKKDLVDLSWVLELFLCWPHQEYFMKTAVLMWEFIPKNIYAALFYKICDRIEPLKDKNLQYGEEKTYDYRYMLKEFWRESPDHYKRYVFQNNVFDFERYFEETTTARTVLLRLLSLKKFTYEDEGIVRSILESANDGEREYLLSATCWKNPIVKLMKDEKFEFFDRLLRVCFRSELEADMFKESLNLFVEAKKICKRFLRYKKLNAIKSFLNRISVTDNQLECLKQDLIYSPKGKRKCLEILSCDGNKVFEEFVGWFLPTEESARAFRKTLTFENNSEVLHLQEKRLFDLVDEYRSAHGATQGSTRHPQESLVDVFKLQICEELICSHSLETVSNDGYSSLYAQSNFSGGQWKKLNQFLSFFPTSKTRAFKKMIFKKAGLRILVKLIEAKQWWEAVRFLNWLEISVQDMRNLKWKALTTKEGTWYLFHYLVFSDADDEAKKVEEVYAMLKWHLTDIISVLEFRRLFLKAHELGYDEAGLNIFTSVLDMYLDELEGKSFERLNAHKPKAGRAEMTENEGIRAEGVERQSPAPAPPKKARLSKPGVKKTQKKNVTVVTEKRRSQRLLDKANKK